MKKYILLILLLILNFNCSKNITKNFYYNDIKIKITIDNNKMTIFKDNSLLFKYIIQKKNKNNVVIDNIKINHDSNLLFINVIYGYGELIPQNRVFSDDNELIIYNWKENKIVKTINSYEFESISPLKNYIILNKSILSPNNSNGLFLSIIFSLKNNKIIKDFLIMDYQWIENDKLKYKTYSEVPITINYNGIVYNENRNGQNIFVNDYIFDGEKTEDLKNYQEISLND